MCARGYVYRDKEEMFCGCCPVTGQNNICCNECQQEDTCSYACEAGYPDCMPDDCSGMEG